MEAIRNIQSRLHHYFFNWQVNSALSGAALSITGCALAIFSAAPFFAICFAFLTGVCLFSAIRLQELGTFKAATDRLSNTENALNKDVADLKKTIEDLKTQLKQSNERGSQMALQIAAYEKTFLQNKESLTELHKAIATDFGKETGDFATHNEHLKRLVEKVEKNSADLINKTAAFSDWLRKEHQTQFDELKDFLNNFQIKQLEECHSLQEKANYLKGVIEQLESHQKKMEENISRLRKEVDRFAEQNQQLDSIKIKFTDLKESLLPLNSQKT